MNLRPLIGWGRTFLRRNPNITYEIMLENPKFEWKYWRICENPNLTLEQILSMGASIAYDIELNPNVTWEIVISRPDIRWNYVNLSKNPNITQDIVESNPEIGWCYKSLCGNPSITWDIITKYNLEPKTKTTLFCENINMTTDMINSIVNSTELCDESQYYCLSGHPNLTWDIVKSNPNKPWVYSQLGRNPSLNWRDLYDQYKSVDEYHRYNLLVYHDSVSIEDVKKYENILYNRDRGGLLWNDNITWRHIYHDILKGEPQYYGDRLSQSTLHRWSASSKIQHSFRRWCVKTKVSASYTILLNIFGCMIESRISSIFNMLPIEICHNIAILTNHIIIHKSEDQLSN